jgi:hypothetical protein
VVAGRWVTEGWKERDMGNAWASVAWRLLQVLFVVSLASCGASPSATHDQPPEPDSNIEQPSRPDPTTEPSPGVETTPKPDLEPGAEPSPTPAAGTGQTPRADAEAEQLALEATGAIVAPQHVYERVVGELAGIRQVHDEVAQLVARPSWIPENILMGFDKQGAAAVRRGFYDAWDALNMLFGLAEIEIFDEFVALTFEGRFYGPLVAEEYARLPNVRYAEPNFTVGDGNDVCLEIDGDTHSFVFVQGDGDCLAGCIEHAYWGFAVDAAGQITVLGTWIEDYENPMPEWLEQLAACRGWL